jgi:threonine/homoserine/homoserine lactone efflux protein
MIASLFEGIILGITLAFLIGPAFVALVQTSIHRGLRSGLLFALGISISDLFLISLSYMGAIQFLTNDSNQFIVGVIGGFILIGFGVVTFFKKYKVNVNKGIEVRVSVSGAGNFTYVLKGFFMNILNPFLLIFWLGVMSFVSAKYGVATKEVVSFFTAAIITVFLTDSIKCLIANQLRRFLNITILTWVNRAVGLSLVIFGVVMFVRVFFHFG